MSAFVSDPLGFDVVSARLLSVRIRNASQDPSGTAPLPAGAYRHVPVFFLKLALLLTSLKDTTRGYASAVTQSNVKTSVQAGTPDRFNKFTYRLGGPNPVRPVGTRGEDLSYNLVAYRGTTAAPRCKAFANTVMADHARPRSTS